ncbi:uncharacterized protein LOC110854784 isoform X2 [Folsomia candida]|uniref:uncharacterized protein LOC110854784 isoform X2 n=1 Tax=Folsomia candida TaxID=158441 RepID=UPI001604EA9E|nr:uncharacterized protein LOC110854784 isoform X2 [Folsomia candida]
MSPQIIFFAVVTISSYFLASVIFVVPMVSINFWKLPEINYSCDWNERMEEYLKTRSPTVAEVMVYWANETGYFESRNLKFSKNYTLDYNDLMNYWDSLPNIEVDGVPEVIFGLKVGCVSNKSAPRFFSESLLKFPRMRGSLVESFLTSGFTSLWPTQLQNFSFCLTQSVYLICSLAGFICLCVTCGGIDTEIFFLLNFVGLEMLLICGGIIQLMNIEQDIFSYVIYFDKNYLQYCPALDAFYTFVPTSQALLVSVLILNRKRIVESSKLQISLYSIICIIFPAGYLSFCYFLSADFRYQCKPSLDFDDYPPFWEAWVSLIHKNGVLLILIGVNLLIGFSSGFDFQNGVENGVRRWSVQFKLLLLVYGISAWLQILEILLYLVVDKYSAIVICRICNFKSGFILFLLVRADRTKDGAPKTIQCYQERLVELTGEFKTRISSKGSTFSLHMQISWNILKLLFAILLRLMGKCGGNKNKEIEDGTTYQGESTSL